MTHPAAAPDNDSASAVAWSLRLDVAAAEAVARLRGAQIPSILLKGLTIASWLYNDGTPRPYGDVDLLVPVADFTAAELALGDLGYVDPLAGAAACEVGLYEKVLCDPAGVCVDLHHRILGVTDPPGRCWDVLSRYRSPLEIVCGTVVDVLDLPARTAHLALHAAQNGLADTKAVEDLRRGLAQVPESLWLQAHAVAQELGAEEAFGAGLRLLPAGRTLADALALPAVRSVELRLRIASASQKALTIDRIARTPGVFPKLAMVARKLFPTVAYLKDQYESARHGRGGRMRARALHFWRAAVDLPGAVREWRRGRRDPRARAAASPFWPAPVPVRSPSRRERKARGCRRWPECRVPRR